MDQFVIGIDFGTDSVRVIVVNVSNGEEVAASIKTYDRWMKGNYCNASRQMFRQHPFDYVQAMEGAVKQCVAQVGVEVAKNIKALSIDTTGSTPVAVNQQGVPLAMLFEFEENPNAMFVLWKDHTAIREAAEINEHNSRSEVDYLKYVGGIYSSEWFWAKILHVLREDEDVRRAAYTWVEHCDWIPFLLTGGGHADHIRRGVCAAGHKGLWSKDINGFPPDEFFAGIDPLLKDQVTRLSSRTYTSSEAAGTISKEWSDRLGLPADTLIGIGAFDAHMGAVGGQIEPYYLSKVMGTSTCDMLVAPLEEIGDTKVKGICGQVVGSIIPGMIGLEAGQSAFGDVYAWMRKLLLWPIRQYASEQPGNEALQSLLHEMEDDLLKKLSEKAAELPLEVDSELAVDWLNGRRTPDADQTLKGGIIGLHLASDAPSVFRALAEATCFGARSIVDRFRLEEIPVKGLIGIGGVAKKSPFIMQMMADVMDMPIRIHCSEQSCAAGAAMFAATVAGLYPDVSTAMHHMGRGFEKTYNPNKEKVLIYAKRYEQYRRLGSFIEHQTKKITED